MSQAVATQQQKLIGRYRPYPEYKDSGVIWSGFIPSHWEPIRFKHVFVEKPKTSNIELPAGSISFGQVVFKDEEKLAEETKASYQEVKAGEFLVNPLNLNFDLKSLRTALSEIDVVVSTGYIVLQCYRQLEARYARWLLHEFDVAHMKSLGAGVRQTIGFNDIGNSYFCMPRLEEQLTIAAFLDHETARIDRLIAQQQRLIELLKEKRQAVISQAVTKGLNPNAPMKDSGVEWLGQVPKHWIVRRLKHHIISMDQGWSPQCEARLAEEDEFGVMKVGCVNGGVFRFSEHKALPAELEPKTEYRLKKGQLLVSRANTRELVGSAAVVDADYDQLLLCDKLYRIKLSSDASPEFVALLLGTSAYRGQIELSASGASDSMQNIGQSTIKELPIAVPPMDEANDILKPDYP
ncbi:restriction endonuclease subunit S [Aeromonas caviae]|uniref:restriction endonuclease subunit S n=2 Tax=Aeromonas caviae TaxID=648 RepID=UPI002B48868D|nr:restriction endonuclease subunit S [Aeromonas caviae]